MQVEVRGATVGAEFLSVKRLLRYSKIGPRGRPIERQIQTDPLIPVKVNFLRRANTFTESPFTMRQLEAFLPADHPLRPIRIMINTDLVKLGSLFSQMYEADIKGGPPPHRA